MLSFQGLTSIEEDRQLRLQLHGAAVRGYGGAKTAKFRSNFENPQVRGAHRDQPFWGWRDFLLVNVSHGAVGDKS